MNGVWAEIQSIYGPQAALQLQPPSLLTKTPLSMKMSGWELIMFWLYVTSECVVGTAVNGAVYELPKKLAIKLAIK